MPSNMFPLHVQTAFSAATSSLFLRDNYGVSSGFVRGFFGNASVNDRRNSEQSVRKLRRKCSLVPFLTKRKTNSNNHQKR